MPDTANADLATAIESLAGAVKSQGEQINALSQPKSGNPTPGQVFNAPAIRSGESSQTSRGYSFLRLAGYAAGILSQDECKVELDLHNRLAKEMSRQGYQKAGGNSLMAPFSTANIGANKDSDAALTAELREACAAGVKGYDPEHVRHMRAKYWGVEKTLSWLDETNGGALVGPPQMGELITLMRNNEVLLQAGARSMPMPANGRFTWPRQTSAMTAYWIGQSQTITESEPGTGDLNLQAKKLGILAKIPNELFRFPSVSFEQFIREDIARVMALKLDKSGLEAVGSGVEPKGVISYAGITAHTAATVAANGDTFGPDDVGTMIAKCEEQNAEFKSWIMRPLLYSKIRNRRADAVTAGDGKGPYLFNMMRSIEEDMSRGRGVGNLEGYPVYKSTQVSNTRVKGSGVDLTYVLGGDFSQVVVAMSGAIEFLMATQGDTMVTTDQTWLRGILYADVGVLREAGLVFCDSLLVA